MSSKAEMLGEKVLGKPEWLGEWNSELVFVD